MISEMFLNIITGIAFGMTAGSMISTYKFARKKVKRNNEKLEKYKIELNKQLLELEKMEKEINAKDIKTEDKKKYEDTKILINSLIKQYNDMMQH